MVNIKIILDKRSKRSDKKYPLSFYIYGAGSARFISLKYYFTEAEYKVIQKNQTHRAIEFNKKLNGYLLKAQQIKASLIPFDFNRFKQLYKQNPIESKPATIFIQDFFKEIIESKKKDGFIKTATTYQHAISSLSKFSNPIKVEDITPEFLKDYQDWYVKNHNGVLNASVGMILRNLRAVINRLKSDNKLPANYQYPFGRNKFQIRSVRKPKRTLTKEEIESLVKLDDFTCDEERKARDLWLMQFYSNGINLKDLLLLKWENKIRSVEGGGDFFVIKRQKTKSTNNVDRFIRIPISDKLSKLLDKYGNNKSPYVLGLIQDGMGEKQIINKKESVGKFINAHLEKIQERLKLSVPLLSKVSRDAYATTLRRNGVSIEIISQNLGHSSVLVTMHYLEDFGFDVINNSNDCLP